MRNKKTMFRATSAPDSERRDPFAGRRHENDVLSEWTHKIDFSPVAGNEPVTVELLLMVCVYDPGKMSIATCWPLCLQFAWALLFAFGGA